MFQSLIDFALDPLVLKALGYGVIGAFVVYMFGIGLFTWIGRKVVNHQDRKQRRRMKKAGMTSHDW